MTSTDPPRYGSTRFTDIGDVEIFDGQSWQPIASLLADAAVSDRDGKRTASEPGASPQPGSDASSA